MSATGPEKWDARDWEAFRSYWLGALTRAVTGETAGVPAGNGPAIVAAHKALLGLVPNPAAIAKAVGAPSAASIAAAVVAALPAPEAGGLTQADVETAVRAVFASAFPAPPAA